MTTGIEQHLTDHFGPARAAFRLAAAEIVDHNDDLGPLRNALAVMTDEEIATEVREHMHLGFVAGAVLHGTHRARTWAAEWRALNTRTA